MAAVSADARSPRYDLDSAVGGDALEQDVVISACTRTDDNEN
ncbi:hypothetical protein [Marinobacter sp. ATCH36]|nr:hypothetical protein [Marinobacter sp. ATCH36]